MTKDFNELIPKQLQPTKEQWQAADEALEIVTLITGYSDEGIPFWVYIAALPSKLIEIKSLKAMPKEPLVNYGRILEAGIGEGPSEEMRKMMEDEYNLNHNFENEIIEAAKEMDKKEKIMGKYTGKKKLDKPTESNEDPKS